VKRTSLTVSNVCRICTNLFKWRHSTFFSFMKSATFPSLATAYQRPQKLYRYSQSQWLERSLQLGEFLLRPNGHESGAGMSIAEQILPFGRRAASASAANYLTLSLASAWDDKLFDAFAGADCCLVIHNTEEFGERTIGRRRRRCPAGPASMPQSLMACQVP
jgi:hypothetical protein